MKNKRTFRLITLILILSMMLVVFTACQGLRSMSNAAKSLVDVGLKYTLNTGGGGYTVSDYYSYSDKEVVIPSTYEGLPVVAIADEAFLGADAKSIILPDSITYIGEKAFWNCNNLTSIVIPDGVTSIKYGTFYGCSSLTSVTIGNNVTSIDRLAFDECIALTSVIIPNSVESIDESAFACCTSLTNISVGENNQNYKSIDGNLYTKDGKSLIQYAIGKTDTSFTIPKSVKSIGIWTFRGCTSLSNITIPDSVVAIDSKTFFGCTSLVYNEYDNAYYLGNDANPYAFLISEKNTNITSCVLHENTKVIADRAFVDCSSLASVTIPSSVTIIGSLAFERCTNLTDIYYTGTEKAWTKITKYTFDAKHTNATIHYNYIPEG